MTGAAATPRTRPRVAGEVAAAVLRALPDAALERVGCVIDWSGPIGQDLTDETAVQAACGVMHVHGRAAGRPLRLGVDHASAVAGLLGAQGVLAALIAGARGLRVDEVRTSVGQAALLAVSQYLAAATAGDAEAVPLLAGGAPPFTCADGVRFEIETLDAGDWHRFWTGLGATMVPVRRGWPAFQHRFATATCRLPDELHALAGRLRWPDVCAAARHAHVGVLPVRADPRHPDHHPLWTARPIPGPARSWPAVTGTDPLDGVVVVESTRRVQGPLAGHVLGMLGASVIRVEPPGGDPMRGMPPMAGDCSARFVALNAGKRVVEADLKTATGRAAVHELVAGADVFLHNWAPGRAARLGLDADDLARTRPGLVYAYASGWGDALGADPPPGTDFLVQAHSGIAAAVRPAESPAPSLMTVTDVLGGLVSALGVLAALLSRTRTGQGSRVDSCLLDAAGVLPRHRPPGSFDHPPRTADGYLALGEDATAERLARALGCAAGPAAVAARMRDDPTDAVADLLCRRDIVATPVCTDLRGPAADARFAPALRHGDCTVPGPPWEFR